MSSAFLKFDLPLITRKKTPHIPVIFLTEKNFKTWRRKQSPEIQNMLRDSPFSAEPEQNVLLRNAEGKIKAVLTGVHTPLKLYDTAHTVRFLQNNIKSKTLKTLSFSFQETEDLDSKMLERAAIGWGLGGYKFTAYKEDDTPLPRLVLDKKAGKARIEAFIRSITLLRNLINTPANDFGPDDLENIARAVAEKCKAGIEVIKGVKLKKEFPLVQAVGEASPRRPRLIDISWGKKSDPKITIVGKGVCYDTGGLNLKPGKYMRNMKKDMGGGAHALALGWLIMSLNLPVRLRILIPAVENAVGGASFRPGDILKSRKGLSVENTNTDAEGRLIVADALTYACEDSPDLLVDYCTLTGSARAALGPDIPAVFSNQDDLAQDLQDCGLGNEDPVWAMPLWAPYKKHIKSPVADLVNSASIPGDLIYSALFLNSFLEGEPPWLHLDIYAWEDSGQPGRPKGGADTGLQAVFALIEKRYG